MKNLSIIIFTLFFYETLFAQNIIIGDLPIKEICRVTSPTVKIRYYNEGVFNGNNIFKIKITRLNQYDSTVYQNLLLDASLVTADTISFKLPSTLQSNKKSIGDRYILQIVSTSPVKESGWSSFFDVVITPDAPSVANVISYCQNETPQPLLPNDSLKYKWYIKNIYEIPEYHPNPIIVNTNSIGVNNYYVSEYNVCGESQLSEVKIIVHAKPTSIPTITSSKTTFKKGESVTLTSSNCADGFLRWSNNFVSNSFSVVLDSTQVFYAFCENSRCTGDRSNEIPIALIPTDYCIPNNVGAESYGVGSSSVKLINSEIKQEKTFSAYRLFDVSNITLASGQTYPFSIQMPKVDYPFSVHISIWIDTNIDGYFNDTGEKVFSSNLPITKGNKVNGNLIIANNARTGSTRMRFRVRLAQEGQINSACEPYDVCETEDYIINLSSDPCPQNRTFTNPTDNIFGGITEYKASQSINSSNQILNKNQPKSSYQAGKSVLLSPGFYVEKGASFKIEIRGCN